MELLNFQPIYQERVWGGRALAERLGRNLPAGGPIGESWEIVDRDEAQSIVSKGSLNGKTLRELCAEHGAELLGPDADPARPFPILVKWLDCRERLSLQVHPPASIAPELGGEPKTENWYIARAEPGAALIVGLKRGTGRADFERALAGEHLEECLHRFPVKPGQSILVESGRLHAIDGGNLILEIQQNSDTTYRVYDWGRKGLDGKPRQLHVEASLRSIDFNDFEPAPLEPREGEQTLAECREFRIRKFDLAPGASGLSLPAGEGARLLHPVSGRLRETHSGEVLGAGDNLLQPYVTTVSLVAEEPSVLLVTDRF